MADALGTQWIRAGHEVMVSGRDPVRARSRAESMNAQAGVLGGAGGELGGGGRVRRGRDGGRTGGGAGRRARRHRYGAARQAAHRCHERRPRPA
ncbi:hypothetical protein ACFFV7_19485 [Nonomuraea spiralis]|uniref:Pyrroline-5-carboxylate reductase catalytic N-terminal domain-containing protein n=1 Tax=Nonomuraea spiralis TaxID=46182 RepID=A0ABV5II31_9ACTN|nr:hypothetical protein [Nonomuraea spiralis]